MNAALLKKNILVAPTARLFIAFHRSFEFKRLKKQIIPDRTELKVS